MCTNRACKRIARAVVTTNTPQPTTCSRCGWKLEHKECKTIRTVTRPAGSKVFTVRVIKGPGEARAHDHSEPPPLHSPPGEDQRVKMFRATLEKSGKPATASMLSTVLDPHSPNLNLKRLNQNIFTGLYETGGIQKGFRLDGSTPIRVYENHGSGSDTFIMVMGDVQMWVAEKLAAGEWKDVKLVTKVGVVDSTHKVCNERLYLTSIVTRTDKHVTGTENYVPLFYAYTSDLTQESYRKILTAVFRIWASNDIKPLDVLSAFVMDFAPAISNGFAAAVDEHVRTTVQGLSPRTTEDVMADMEYMKRWENAIGRCLFHWTNAILTQALSKGGTERKEQAVRKLHEIKLARGAEEDPVVLRKKIDNLLVWVGGGQEEWWRKIDVHFTVYGLSKDNEFTPRTEWETTSNGIERHWVGISVREEGGGKEWGGGDVARVRL